MTFPWSFILSMVVSFLVAFCLGCLCIVVERGGLLKLLQPAGVLSFFGLGLALSVFSLAGDCIVGALKLRPFLGLLRVRRKRVSGLELQLSCSVSRVELQSWRCSGLPFVWHAITGSENSCLTNQQRACRRRVQKSRRGSCPDRWAANQYADFMRAELIIRRMIEAVSRTVAELWHATKKNAYPYLPLEQARTLAADSAFFHQKLLPRCEIWVAEQQGQVVGFLAIQGSYIDRLYVQPSVQRVGFILALSGMIVGWSRNKQQAC
jgi:hypothetical protein